MGGDESGADSCPVISDIPTTPIPLSRD